MAKHNPFSIFRRNQKAWMAGLTLFTMFSFIALGSMLQCVGARNEGTGPRYTDQVAKTSQFGKLDYNDFLNERQNMYRLGAFLDAIASAAQALKAQPSEGLTLLRMETELASSDAEILVDRWLVTKCAEKEGLVPDDAAVLEYLQLLTQVVQYGENNAATAGSIPSDSLATAMRVAGLNESGLRDLLKSQIAYERMIRKVDAGRRMDAWYNTSGIEQMAFGHGEPLSTPADALEAYNALNRMVKAKVAVFKASAFVDKVAEPSDDVAKKFYQQYKNVTFHADSATPGFTQPVKLALELVRADINDEVLDSISMEDVKQYYEEHKEEFRIPKSTAPAAPTAPAADAVSLPGADTPALNALPDDALDSFGGETAPEIEVPAEETAPATEAPAEEAAPATKAPAEEAAPATEAPAEEAAPATEAPAEEAAPASEAPAEEAAPASEAPAEEAAPATEAPAEEAAPAETPAEETMSYAVSQQLVAYQQDAEGAASTEEAPAEEPASTEEAPAEEPAPANEAPAEEPAPADEAPAEEPAPANEAPAEEPAPANEAPAEEPASADEAPAEESAPAEETPAEATPAAETADSEYLPLEDVERFIRTRIAAERIEAKMAALTTELQNYYHETISDNENAAAAAKDVDMAAYAAENGLKYLKTTRPDGENAAFPVLVSQDEAAIMDILPEETLRQIYSSAPLQNAPQRVGQYDPENNPMQRFNPPTEFYVFRAIETKNETTPEFEEIQDEVVLTWKLREAAKLADEAAKKFVEAASAEGADFDKLAADANATVVETEKFSWFKSSLQAYGSYAQPSEIREAGVAVGEANRDNKEIVAPGWSFYETVFGLQKDGVGYCQNQSKDRAFVVKVVESEEPETEDLAKISADQSVAYVTMWLRRARLEKFHQDFMKQLRDKSGFEWLWIPRVEENR